MPKPKAKKPEKKPLPIRRGLFIHPDLKKRATLWIPFAPTQGEPKKAEIPQALWSFPAYTYGATEEPQPQPKYWTNCRDAELTITFEEVSQSALNVGCNNWKVEVWGVVHPNGQAFSPPVFNDLNVVLGGAPTPVNLDVYHWLGGYCEPTCPNATIEINVKVTGNAPGPLLEGLTQAFFPLPAPNPGLDLKVTVAVINPTLPPGRNRADLWFRFWGESVC